MKKIFTYCSMGAVLLFFACKPAPKLTESSLIPIPQEIKDGKGVFELNSESGIHLIGSGEHLTWVGEYLADRLRPATGFDLPVSYDGGNIRLELAGDGNAEAYSISIDENQVSISSSGEAGLFYGIQSLLQLFPAEIAHQNVQNQSWVIPAGAISDQPAFGYRGAMLDVARHFLSVEDVKHYIDQMAVYKLNYLHLHLTDDQGWRIEIKSWPKLTEIGGSTEVGGGEGGFYTQEEYKDLVAYAADRFITIVPEVDMPGHTNSALASYAELNPGVNLPNGKLDSVNKQPLDYQMPLRNPQASELYTGIEVGWSTFAPKLEITYAFVDSVVREIAELTPGPYFHIGGDESHVTEKDDYVYFVERVQDIVSKYGKTSIGWDEIATAKLLPGNVAQFWAKEENAKLAIGQGNQILMSPATRAYLDMQYDSTSRIGLHWAAYIELEDAYSWEPSTFAEGIAAENILGVEAPLWTETVTNREDMEYLSFPRLPALAEVAWTSADKRSWEGFKNRIQKHGSRWNILGIQYYPSPQVNWEGK
ncbi:beta-N-acetylhexosaminidase [Algoriphagus taiwanensis]|uniref:beta-N-acetylhexosaminidase n=1 Tax=Algoriphagus taiwanensis TaxID=1445656 RepID=A0ABQ6PXX3_9BACT|nr:beta-N-acetylhexosaminidase [Algoriphagus taiwanensis]